MLKALLSALVILGTGCASFSTHMTPRPTAKGSMEIDAHVDVLAFTDDDGGRAVRPNVEMMFRYGLSDMVDVGAKVNAAGLELSSRIGILLSDSLDLGIVPSAGVLLRSDATGHAQLGVVTFGAPILAGVHISESTTLLFGAKFYGHLSTIATEREGTNIVTHKSGELVFYPGGVIGLELLVSDNFALFPELNFLFPYLLDFDKFARPVWQGGIAFQFRIAS